MKKLFLIFTFFLSMNILFSQTTIDPSPIKWYDIETAIQLYQKNPKPLMIDVYTDWCGWCKYMMKTTFANKNLSSYINTYFYPVRFNAETKDTVFFQGKQYINRGKTHDLALFLLNNRPAYPTLVFFDRNFKKYVIPGYKKIKDLEPILVYFHENIGQNVDLNTFELAYRLAYPKRYKEDLEKIPQNKLPDTTAKVKWLSFSEAWQKNSKNPKQILIFGYVPWCYSCKPMEKLVFTNPHIVNYINKNFYPIKFNAATTDTLMFYGNTYVSMGHGQPHQLAMILFKQGFQFPAILFLNSQAQNIGSVYGFYSPEQLMPILNYFNSQAYKKQSFQNFVQEITKNEQ